MINAHEIRRLANGAIDTNYYAQIGRQRRSEALYDGGRAITDFGSAAAAAIKRIRLRPPSRYSGGAVART